MNKLTTLLMASAIAIAATSCGGDSDDPEIIDNSTTNVNVTINGHKFVDLGLPSGTLWAETNIGASTPYEDGDYFAWAETKPKSRYSLDNQKSNVNKYKDGKTTLDAADDAATANWGSSCRMPTTTEMKELKDKCTWTWKSNYNGASGYLVKGSNGNSIFLPATGLRDEEDFVFHGTEGNYWSSQTLKIGKYGAEHLSFSNDDFDILYSNSYMGYTVRPVANKSDNDSSNDDSSQDGQDDDTSPDGHEHKLVDLGLPSGTLWAETNIGASTPYEAGDNFAWGETKPKDDYDWINYKWGSNYYNLNKYNSKDGKTTLDATDDAAKANWGKKYRIPTRSDIQELIDNCKWTWQTGYNKSGGYVVKGSNGNQIFIPADGSGGWYWSSSLCDDHSSGAYFLCIAKDKVYPISGNIRCYGLMIRPVSDKF